MAERLQVRTRECTECGYSGLLTSKEMRIHADAHFTRGHAGGRPAGFKGKKRTNKPLFR